MMAHGEALFNVVSVFQDVQAAPVLLHVLHVGLGLSTSMVSVPVAPALLIIARSQKLVLLAHLPFLDVQLVMQLEQLQLVSLAVQDFS